MGVFQFPYGKVDNSNKKGEKICVSVSIPYGKVDVQNPEICLAAVQEYQFPTGKSTIAVTYAMFTICGVSIPLRESRRYHLFHVVARYDVSIPLRESRRAISPIRISSLCFNSPTGKSTTTFIVQLHYILPHIVCQAIRAKTVSAII